MNTSLSSSHRRAFLQRCTLAAGALALPAWDFPAWATELPAGSSPQPVASRHFPDRLHAFVWRNWQLVPVERMAAVVGAKPRQILRLGRAMGLQGPPRITAGQRQRSYITVIRRNWHLLPYDQLLELLGWSAEQMEFALREDDFLFVKLGNLKPACARLRYVEPDAAARRAEAKIAQRMRAEFPQGTGVTREPLFGFVDDLSRMPERPASAGHRAPSRFSPRFCYSYFALYGDPLLEPGADPYPEGYLARLAEAGVDGVWLQAVLPRLAPFPWDPSRSERYQERLAQLRRLVARAQTQGIGIYLYLNEPRSLPLEFFGKRPELKGVTEGAHAALCTSQPEVREYLAGAVATLCRNVPDLAGMFTITGSENFTHCWSHGNGGACPRCGPRGASEVVAELLITLREGIQSAHGKQKLIAWDWGWADAWVPGIVERLPADVWLQSVSEWSLPIERGGVRSEVGEYSISAVGPGPRARRHWALARQRGLRTLAKVQCGNTWELSAVPYIPAVANVANHAANLRQEGVDGLMLSWTLGGYPSPNLEVVAELGRGPNVTAVEAMDRVARRRFGEAMAPAVVTAWQAYSEAFSEFPFGAGLYSGPLQMGPANPLWLQATGYSATMVGYPYDDLGAWCGQYPPEVFAAQLARVAGGFEAATAALETASQGVRLARAHQGALAAEIRVAQASALHFRSAANQCRFVLTRRAWETAPAAERARHRAHLEQLLRSEIDHARRLHALQTADSRFGFEASNHYYYVPADLAEKVLNCLDILDQLAT